MEQIEVITQKQTQIQIAHSLVEAKLKNSTLQQMKILLMIANRIQNTRELKAENLDINKIYHIRFNQSDFVKELELTQFEDCKKSILELQKQQISYKTVDEEGTWKSYENFFTKSEFLEDKEVRLNITGSILTFLALLHKQGYTKIIKQTAMSINSKYTLRMYEICSKIMQQTTKRREYELTEFYEMLGVPKSIQDPKSLKFKILDIAKEELEQKTNLIFNYEFTSQKSTGKPGRPSHTHISLTVSNKD